MKSPFFILIGLALTLCSCDKESEILKQPGLSEGLTLSGKDVGVIQESDVALERKNCVELYSISYLVGAGTNLPVKEHVKEEFGPDASNDRFVIEASGDAMSEQFSRGFTQLALVYDAKTYKVTGEVTTRFENQEELVLKIDGDTQVNYEGDLMKLVVHIADAKFTIAGEDYSLDNGKIVFALPSAPEGDYVKVEVITNALLCKR